jgi:hypothetical protein
MARKEKKYHYIYKTTNIKNGKFYVGMHSTDNLNDGYLGSGLRLRRSIRKNGAENFKLEILEFLSDRSSLKEREKNLVNEGLLKDPLCMNLVFGGGGGYISPNGCKQGGIVAGKIIADRIKNDSEFRMEHTQTFIKRVKKLWQTESYRTNQLKKMNWTGKKHKEETKIKIGEANSLKQKGERNSQFGTCWVTNGTKNKKVKKIDKLSEGWCLGRIKTNDD